MTTLGSSEIRDLMASRLNRLRPDTKALWGKMSANQMLCHLTDSFKGCMGEKFVSPGSLPVPAPKAFAKWFALYVPLKWPKGVPTRPEMEQGVGGTPPSNFEIDRAELLSYIDRFSVAARQKPMRHPMFGDMSEKDWLRWAYLHMDHHFRQFGI